MNFQKEFGVLNLSVEAAPSHPAARSPLCAALRSFDDGSFVCCLAIEAVQFEIPPPTDEKIDNRNARFETGLIRAVQALLATGEPIEFFQILTNRIPGGADGSMTRFGWVVVGRGPTVPDAMNRAQTNLVNLHSIITAFYGRIETCRVADPLVLLDLVRPLCAPYIKALRRVPVSPSLATGAFDLECPPILPALRPGGLAWEPLIRALSSPPNHCAFVVHAFLPVSVPGQIIESIEKDAVTIHGLIDTLVNRSGPGYVIMDRVNGVDAVVDQHETMAILLTTRQNVLDTIHRRIMALKDRCGAVELSINSWEPLNSGLVGVTWACCTGNNIPVRTMNMAAGALWSDYTPLYDPCFSADTIYTPSELWGIVRLPESPVDETSPLPCSRSRILPLRTPGEAGTCLGHALYTGKSVGNACIDEETRLRHVYIVGQTGTGKSTLLLNMALDDITSGAGVTILDPHGSLITDILARIPPEREEDVVMIDPVGTGIFPALNPLAVPVSSRLGYTGIRDRILDELIDTFDIMYDLHSTGGPIFERYFRTMGALIMGPIAPEEYTPMLSMFDIVMSNRKLMETLVKRHGIDDPIPAQAAGNIMSAKGEVELANVVPYITSKLTRFISQSTCRRMLCRKGCLDFDDILARRKILLVDLSPGIIGSDSAALIARQIIMRLTVAALERGVSDCNPSHYIYADEFHNFASEHFASLLSEARKFRLGLVLAHQYTSQLLKRNGRVLNAVLGNVGTVVTFRVGVEDARLLSTIMAPQAGINDICGQPNFHALVRSTGLSGNTPFSLTTRPRPATNSIRGETIRKSSAGKYGSTAEEADKELDEETKRMVNLSEAIKKEATSSLIKTFIGGTPTS